MVKPGAPAKTPVPGTQPKPNQAVAKALYMAQLAASKNDCDCNTCKIVRKMSDIMVEQYANNPDADDAELDQGDAVNALVKAAGRQS